MKKSSNHRVLRVLTMPIPFYHAVTILGLLALLAVFLYPNIERFFIFYPERIHEASPQDFDLSFEEVYLETPDHVRLHGWYFPGDALRPVILFCHGNAGNISHRLDNVRRLVDHDLAVFLFDYRGYGKSTGTPSEKGIYRDGLAAYDYLLHEKGLLPDRIVLFGRSLGAAVATEIALRRPARSLILESAFTSTRDMARTIPLFKLFSPFIPSHFNTLEKLSTITLPKLIIHGTRDEIVPFRLGHRLFERSLRPKYFVPLEGAGHNDTYLVGGSRYFETLFTFVRDSAIAQTP